MTVAVLAAVVGAGCGKDSTTPTSPSTTTSPSSFTFTSQLAVHGSTSRTFVMTTAGTVNVTMGTLGDGNLKAGIGIGVLSTGLPCSLAQSVVTGPGAAPQLSINADAGTYCVAVWDPGTLTEDTAFSLTVNYP